MPPPQSIAESITEIKTFALYNFTQEAATKQLYYHNHEHIQNVQRRSQQIFQAIADYHPEIDRSRTELLLDLCVVAHDMVQVFAQNSQQNTARKRDTGVSEMATIEQILQYIHQLNSRLDADSSARLTEADIDIIRESIEATICVYDPIEQAIYQPSLQNGRSLSIVARILALADLGALGIDGIEVYNEEGSLIFLEENLDVVPLLMDGSIHQLKTNSALHENIRHRLLRRSRFQVHFAKSRLARFDREIQEFSSDAIPILKEIFKHLTPENIQIISTMTPTDEAVSLADLLQFFQLERYLRSP
ncbi:hypothetical protein H6F67_03665 [Microcoleus sp. FACHB-1515]|nr:hypothetical protein [Microcoleus sp. FACHB-1515]